MILLAAVVGLNVLATAVLAAWAIYRIRRLRVSVRLAHGDLEDLKHYRERHG
ncbi:hypothetical protein [Paracoccus suum]|uniref:hypothetical protein n=1 Tax=Paracoccus suum TaxID=2259340 RepID=UPI0013B05F65|nr:hypothetical protein [Paracoccus suum]